MVGPSIENALAGSPVTGDIVMDLPEGTYHLSCYSPVTGLYSPALSIQGGQGFHCSLPEFVHDIVIRITKKDQITKKT